MAAKKQFVPSASDKMWLIRTLSMITEGGLWVTDYAQYKKANGKLVCERSANEMGENNNMNNIDIERNINRDRIVCEAIGVEFVDNRKTKYN